MLSQMIIKKILYFDANSLYGHSMSQMLPYDEIEMWHGHPDLYNMDMEKNKKFFHLHLRIKL